MGHATQQRLRRQFPYVLPAGGIPAYTNILYHNRGDGTFEDVSVRSGIAAKKGHALGVAFADYDGDGLTDIYVANDGMQQSSFITTEMVRSQKPGWKPAQR